MYITVNPIAPTPPVNSPKRRLNLKTNMPATRGNWSRDWSVKIRVRVERDGKTVLDERSAELLAALEQTHSISAAARLLGVSYRHAWLLVQEANEAAGQPLLETEIGGTRGGGARLTEYGRAALRVFEQLQARLRTSAAKALPKALAGTRHDRAVLHVFAAISLQEILVELLAEYALTQPTVSVRTVFGASDELAEQILTGGSADLFIAASSDPIDQLAAANMLCKGSRCILAKNGLVAVAAPGFAGRVRTPRELANADVRQIIVADPTCPLGKYTADFLESAAVIEELRSRFVYVDNSRAVVSTIRRRRNSAGIIFSSDRANAAELRMLFQSPAGRLCARYEGAVLGDSTASSEADALLEFLSSTRAKQIFRRGGFLA
jgi:molybdenum ABC transporter molybdate-binding protein